MKLHHAFVLMFLLLCLVLLPSCAELKSVGPIRAKVTTDQGTVGYDSKSGLEVEVDARSAK